MFERSSGIHYQVFLLVSYLSSLLMGRLLDSPSPLPDTWLRGEGPATFPMLILPGVGPDDYCYGLFLGLVWLVRLILRLLRQIKLWMLSMIL